MTPPVQITLIVCITIVLVLFGLATIQMLEKRNDKKKSDEDVDLLKGYDNMP